MSYIKKTSKILAYQFYKQINKNGFQKHIFKYCCQSNQKFLFESKVKFWQEKFEVFYVLGNID